MRRSIFIKLSFAVLSSIALHAYPQSNNALKNITAKLNAYTSEHVVEKAYLQMDKPYYAAGDTIYFKAYVTLGQEHKLSALSGILNVDLVSPAGKITRSIKLPVVAGVAWGDFAIADTLKAGNYRIRAYTSWMRNDGEADFFEKILPVGSAAVKKIPESSATNTGRSGKIDVQFFPEGGALVAGTYSKIAFKAIAPNGLGTDIKGNVTDEAGNKVCTFTSTHSGMGSFNMVPGKDKSYKANITFADGTTRMVELPKAASSGYTLAINNDNPDTVRLRVTTAGSSDVEQLSLVAQAGGIVCYAAESTPGNRLFSAVIPKSRFPTGITQFTLFNTLGEPLNERLIFINHNDQLQMKLYAKDSYTTREKVKIQLNARDMDNKPATGSFSVAVTDEDKIPVNEQAENGILSNLLLTSDLKGTVENPGYYFTNNADTTKAHLDLLMLTQGYRRFEWKQVLGNTIPPTVYTPEKTLVISGRITKNGKPVPNGKITLFTTAGGAFMIDTLSDASGRFAFRNLVFDDSTKFVVQSRVAKGQDAVTLDVDTLQPPAIQPAEKNRSAEKLIANSNMSAYLINQEQFYREQQKYGINKHPVILQEVHIQAKKEPIIPHSQNLNGPGNADKIFTQKELEAVTGGRLYYYMQSKIPYLKGVPWGGYGPMPILIDGNLVDGNIFNDLSPDDLEGIEVITGPHYGAIYGSRFAGGGIIVTTKRAHKVNNYYRYAPGVVTIMPKGFYKAREFYSPQYDDPKTNTKITDLRSTIYWKPDIITDKDGNASFSYFNADGKGTYRMVIEGIDADGNLGRQVFRYQVE